MTDWLADAPSKKSDPYTNMHNGMPARPEMLCAADHCIAHSCPGSSNSAGKERGAAPSKSRTSKDAPLFLQDGAAARAPANAFPWDAKARPPPAPRTVTDHDDDGLESIAV